MAASTVDNIEIVRLLIQKGADIKLKDSPFKIIDNIHIDSTETIAIEAGVKLYFSDSSRIHIEGRLLVNGNNNMPVVFTSIDSNWVGFIFRDSPRNSILNFAIIENATRYTVHGAREVGAIELTNSSAAFNNCIFRHNSAIVGGAICCQYSELSIQNCIFYDNRAFTFGGAIQGSSSKVYITNSTFCNNFCKMYGGAAFLHTQLESEHWH